MATRPGVEASKILALLQIELGAAPESWHHPAMGAFRRSLLTAGALLGLVAACQPTAPTAGEILASAQSAAAAGNKNIFLLFDASW